jgi:glycosyltransferase involved in cell wall biosynthesis
VIRYYANALAVFYAPYDEDYGYATIEAFLSKRPVITTIDSGGVLEFVRHKENGFLTNNDPMEIAEWIDWLHENRDRCADLGSHGYELVKDIAWDNIIERLMY